MAHEYDACPDCGQRKVVEARRCSRCARVQPHPGKGIQEPIPAGPFVDWVNREIARRERLTTGVEDSPETQVVLWLTRCMGWTDGRGPRTLYRFRSGEQTIISRAWVEDSLHHAGVLFHDVYPDLVEDIVLEPDAWCPECRETVTPSDGRCLWCDTLVAAQLELLAAA